MVHLARTLLCCSVGRIFAQNAVVSDDLPARIISGRIQVKPNVMEFCGSSLVFADGSVIDQVCCKVLLEEQNFQDYQSTKTSG